MSAQRLLWPDVDAEELQAGWHPLVDVPRQTSFTASDVLNVLARRHDEGGWNGRPGRWVFLREVPAATGSYGDAQRFDGLALGLVPSNDYGRLVYEVKVSRADWLRELRPRQVLSYNGRRVGGYAGRQAASSEPERERLWAAGYRIEEQAKWAAAMEIATEFWYAAPVRTILPAELPDGAGLLEVRPWGRQGELRARVVVKAKRLDPPPPGPEFWASALRCLAGRLAGASL